MTDKIKIKKLRNLEKTCLGLATTGVGVWLTGGWINSDTVQLIGAGVTLLPTIAGIYSAHKQLQLTSEGSERSERYKSDIDKAKKDNSDKCPDNEYSVSKIKSKYKPMK